MKINPSPATKSFHLFIRSIFALTVSAALLLCGCTGQSGDPGSTTDTQMPDTENAETVYTPAGPDGQGVNISELRSVLSSSGLGTNMNSWSDEGAAWHGGQQTRICRTGRGIYTAFAKDFGDDEDQQKFYVARTLSDGSSKLLYYGQFSNDGGEVTVNIGHDTVTGDVIATATTQRFHAAYIFDAETDEMTASETIPIFTSGREPSYSQVMYDFENRKLYVFSICGSGTKAETVGDFLLEWMTFDLETRTWSEESVHSWTKDIGRHGYMYPFPDGSGGAYVLAMRNEYIVYFRDRLPIAETVKTYVWDRLDLFHIPDMTTSEGVEYVMVQAEDDSMAADNIWTNTQINQYGDVFIDSEGYIHITYRKYLVDYTGTNTDYDNKLEFRHAVYDGLECVFNEKLDLFRDDYELYRPMVRQDKNGKLHLIVATVSDRQASSIELDLYIAEDSLGRSWKPEKTLHLDEGITTDSLSLSGVREGSVQDGIISGFIYGYRGFYSSAYVFDLDLTECTVSGLTDILDGYSIQIDDRSDKRIPYADHQPVIVSTEDAVYAAFVYNYVHDEDLDYFHIVKLGRTGSAEVIYSGSYESYNQTRFMTMYRDPDGLIYVCPPTGNTVYTIDPENDEVTLRTLSLMAPTQLNLIPQQVDMVFGTYGNDYLVSASQVKYFGISSKTYDASEYKIPLKTAKYSFDRELEGGYTDLYTFSDGNNGLYIVGTRSVKQQDLGGKLEYRGYTQSLNDSAKLFHISDLSEGGEIRCIDIQTPCEDDGTDGIWSVVKIDDAYLGADGKLYVVYTYYLKDFDDADRRDADKLMEDSIRHTVAVFEDGMLVSGRDIKIDGLTKDSSLRLAESPDGTKYLIECNLLTTETCLTVRWNIFPEDYTAKIRVFREEDDGWALAAEKELGDYTAEGMYVSTPRNGSSVNGTVDVLVYTSDRDVHYLNIEFETTD